MGYNLLMSKTEIDKNKFEVQKVAKQDNHDSFEAYLDGWIQSVDLGEKIKSVTDATQSNIK